MSGPEYIQALQGSFCMGICKLLFSRVPIIESDKPFTAFEAGGNLYQFRRIPFGVTNGVACFERTLNNIIKAERIKYTFAYTDNVTVCGKTRDETKNLKYYFKRYKKQLRN
ncbi:hypothetical protein T265_11387 [Opisthorchis viverrini]|uniref:Reverse transcriptase domain-containing protein n=1 Tax=Opisthorchis viverrini TaxID=6198 RepID=A0A074Z361_OPIVI|nr:hypothetical protein T265_11387 [Opisthorchis viverrini]KER19962.1 hypothetical protein T265_11387 [Opisthorchis viverrini]